MYKRQILSPSGAYYAGGLAPVDIYVEDKYVRAVRGGIGFAKTEMCIRDRAWTSSSAATRTWCSPRACAR